MMWQDLVKLGSYGRAQFGWSQCGKVRLVEFWQSWRNWGKAVSGGVGFVKSWFGS